MGSIVNFFNEIDASKTDEVGDLASKLAELYNKNFPVQSGFIVNKNAFMQHLQQTSNLQEIKQLLDQEVLKEKSQKIREIILNSKISNEIRKEILNHYHRLDGDGGKLDLKTSQALNIISVGRAKNPRINLMLSTNTKGLINHRPNIIGDDELINEVLKLWAEHFKPLNIFIREKLGLNHFNINVVITKFLEANKSARTLPKNPITGEEEIIIEAVNGFPYSIDTSNEEPDHYVLNASNFNVKNVQIKKQNFSQQYDLRTNRITQKELSHEKGTKTVLNEEEVKRMAYIASKINAHLGESTEVEFILSYNRIYINSLKSSNFQTSFGNLEESNKQQKIIEGIGASSGIVKGVLEKDKITKNDSILLTNKILPNQIITNQLIGVISQTDCFTNQLVSVLRTLQIPCIIRSRILNEINTAQTLLDAKTGQVHTIQEPEYNPYQNSVEQQDPYMQSVQQNSQEENFIPNIPPIMQEQTQPYANMEPAQTVREELSQEFEILVRTKNLEDLQKIVRTLNASGINIKVHEKEQTTTHQEEPKNYLNPVIKTPEPVVEEEFYDNNPTMNTDYQQKTPLPKSDEITMGDILTKKYPQLKKLQEENEDDELGYEENSLPDFDAEKDLGIPTIPKHFIKEAKHHHSEEKNEEYY